MQSSKCCSHHSLMFPDEIPDWAVRWLCSLARRYADGDPILGKDILAVGLMTYYRRGETAPRSSWRFVMDRMLNAARDQRRRQRRELVTDFGHDTRDGSIPYEPVDQRNPLDDLNRKQVHERIVQFLLGKRASLVRAVFKIMGLIPGPITDTEGRIFRRYRPQLAHLFADLR